MMKTSHGIIYSMEGLINYGVENRPWGNFERFTLNEKTTVKIIAVNAGEELSLQVHEHRDEFGRVLKGAGTVQIGEKNIAVHDGDSFFIPRNTNHRVSAGSEELIYLEIAFGDFDENDETRIEDEYGRV
jgi:mannose-1-phosphate guanylyltransferase/mannose-1-phosphate guanylyltransferase/mannose-6-phosphate isomerase